MIKDIISLTEKFIAIESTQENIQARKKILDLALSGLDDFTIEKFNQNGQESALIYSCKSRPKKFKIILNGHLDVVPGKKESYAPKIKNDKLYGVGCLDMKASVACIIHVFKESADKVDYPLGLQLVTDEEIGGFDGTKFQVDQGVKTDFVIACEPTNFDIVNKAKGVLWIKATAKGKTAHGAYPWRGQNAIEKIIEFAQKFATKYPNPANEQWLTTINLSKIETNNEAMNKIPDSCSAFFDVRYIPEDKDRILEFIKKSATKDLKLEVIVQESSLLTDKKNKFIFELQSSGKSVIKRDLIIRSAQGTSDARHFASIGCPGIEFGPVGGNIGGENEWVSIKSIEQYKEILEGFLLSA